VLKVKNETGENRTAFKTLTAERSIENGLQLRSKTISLQFYTSLPYPQHSNTFIQFQTLMIMNI